jgi:hypothetical protein
MVTTVGSRPSHYDVLGLAPEATAEEIGQAFVGKMSLFRARPMAEIAQVTAAYETLRDPAKREAYDEAIGLRAKPDPEPEPMQWSFRVSQQSWAPFIASVKTDGLGQAAAVASPEPHVTARAERKSIVEPERRPELTVEPRVASIAASLRELAKPTARAAVEAVPPRSASREEPAREQAPSVSLEQLVREIRASGKAEKERPQNSGDRPIEWRRPAMAVGGLVVGVGLLGGLAGVVAGGAARDSVTVAVPAAKPAAKAQLMPAPLAASLVETPPQPVRPDAAVARAARSRAVPQPGFAEKELVDLSQASHAVTGPTTQLADATSEQAVAEVVPASLPLPKAVIARTIDRIGYSCGEVASATPAEGQGAFKITCTSGQSYQAAPVRGRYHFRRLGRN